MRRILYSRKFWLTILVLLVSVISILIYVNIKIIMNHWFDVLKLSIGVVGIITTLFNYWTKFNLFITRVWIILTNSSSIWNVSSNFEGDFGESKFAEIMDGLRRMDSVTDFFEISDTYVKLNINGLQYSFEYSTVHNENGIDTQGKIYCYISDFNSSYSHSITLFEDVIVPYFGRIEGELPTNHTSYTFKISFNGKNPFVRMITKNINSKTLSNLWYTLDEQTTVGKRNVKISHKSVECTTNNITDFQKSSTNFISLVGE